MRVCVCVCEIELAREASRDRGGSSGRQTDRQADILAVVEVGGGNEAGMGMIGWRREAGI